MKKKKYLPLYYQWMTTGRLPAVGLCNSLGNDETLMLFAPQRSSELSDDDSPVLWGSGVDRFSSDLTSLKYRGFTTLRQTILLFMAAINDEL